MNRRVLNIGLAVLVLAGVCPQEGLAKKNSRKPGDSEALARGRTVFENKCALCHYRDREDKKIGPGLKGMYKRGTFVTNGHKVSDESLNTWIQNGDQMMPPFKEVLDQAQIQDVIAYIKTL